MNRGSKDKRPLATSFHAAAYGGEGWQSRTHDHKDEIGVLWAQCGICDEWSRLDAVVLHRPGDEISASRIDPNAVLMLAAPDVGRAGEEHDQMAQTYRDSGVTVHMLDPDGGITPNLMFCADLFAMTPQGAILARPASAVRAGEERLVAHKLAEIGVPILKTLTGRATFEGADLMWLNSEQAVLGVGLRTNQEAAVQISRVLDELGASLLVADLPFGTMHLMGMLRIVDHNLALAWPRRTPHAAVTALRDAGYEVLFLSETGEAEVNRAFNFVTLGPRRILVVDGNPATRDFYESLGIECIAVPASELGKAAGAIGCLTGILQRRMNA